MINFAIDIYAVSDLAFVVKVHDGPFEVFREGKGILPHLLWGYARLNVSIFFWRSFACERNEFQHSVHWNDIAYIDLVVGRVAFPRTD